MEQDFAQMMHDADITNSHSMMTNYLVPYHKFRGFSPYANFITANFITAIFQKNP